MRDLRKRKDKAHAQESKTAILAQTNRAYQQEKATRSLASCLVLPSTHVLDSTNRMMSLQLTAITLEPIEEPLGANGFEEGVLACECYCSKHHSGSVLALA